MSEQPAIWNRHFLAICFSSFFMFMSFYILIVTLPIFVMDTLHGRPDQVGMIMTSFVITAVLLRPLAGKWLDEGSKKKILMVGLGIFLASMLLYPFVHSYSMLLVLRLFHGIGFGIAATATGAIAADLVPIQRKGEGVGYFGLFMSLAMVLGPFVGLTILESFSDTVVFLACIVLALLSLLFALTVTPTASVHGKKQIPPATGWKRYIEPNAISIAVSASLLAFAYSGVTAFISIYAKDLGLVSTASFFFMVFAFMIIISRPFTGKTFDRKGPHVLVYPSLIVFIIGLIGLGHADSPTSLLIVAAVLGLGYGALIPSFQTIAVKSSPAHRTGLATATFFLFFDTGFGVGSSVLGMISSSYGYSVMYTVAGIVVMCALPLYYWFNHRQSPSKKHHANIGQAG